MTNVDNNQAVKVLHVTFDMRIGGTEMVIKNIIQGNDDSSLTMSIFCIEEPLGPWGQELREQGIEVASCNRSEGFDLNVIKSLRSHIKQHKIDVLHCHQYTPWVYATIASLGSGARVIFTEHGRFYPDSSSWKRRFVNPVLAFFTDKITAISQATKQALVDFEFLKQSRINVVYNGIIGLQPDQEKTTRVREQLGLSDNDLVFGTIARLDPIKNHTMMLKAFAEAKKELPNAKLVIVGDGDLMPSLRQQTTELELDDSVIFTGYIPYPKDHLDCFDAFLLPSLSEGTSMTLLEAMSLGKPCIVTDAGGNKEIVAHDITGLVTPNDDMQRYAEALITIGNNPEQLRSYGQAGRERFEQMFEVSIMSRQYNEYYHS